MAPCHGECIEGQAPGLRTHAHDSITDRLGRAGRSSAAEPLFAALYEELHRLARRELSRQARPGQRERDHAAARGVSRHRRRLDGASFPDRARFMAYASRVMRGLIIDYARNRQAAKRGGQFEITSIRTDVAESHPPDGASWSEHRRRARRTRQRRPRARRGRRPEVLLRLLVRGNRRDAGRIGAHGAARLGKGAHLPPSVASASHRPDDMIPLRSPTAGMC